MLLTECGELALQGLVIRTMLQLDIVPEVGRGEVVIRLPIRVLARVYGYIGGQEIKRQVRILRGVPANPGYLIRHTVGAHDKRLPDGRGGFIPPYAEIPVCRIFRQDGGIWRGQGRSQVAGQQRIGKHGQKGIVHRDHLLAAVFMGSARNDLFAKRLHAGMSDHFRIVILHRLPDPRIGDRSMLDQFAVLIPVIVNPVQIPCILIELIVAQLEIHILKDQQAGGHTDSQPDHIDKGKDLILADIPPGGDEIALKHVLGFILQRRLPAENVAAAPGPVNRVSK